MALNAPALQRDRSQRMTVTPTLNGGTNNDHEERKRS
jgi:hypothetical protein